MLKPIKQPDISEFNKLMDEAKRQATFDSVYYMDENGEYQYDMDAIEAVLHMDPDDVPDEVYDRIALAYTCMDAEEVEDMMLAMMERDEDVDYPWYNEWFGPAAGMMNEDYSAWVLNEDVYDEMTAAMSRVTQGNLAMINYCDQMYSETNDPAWLDMARQGNEFRMNLVQREAMLNALGTIEDFHGSFEGDKPIFDVDQNSDGSFVIEFNEWRNVGSSISPVFSNFGESTITIDPCLDGTTFAIQDTENVELMLHNQFAPGFTSNGFESDEACAKFWVEHLLGYGYSNGENACLNALPEGVSTAAGYGSIAVHAVYDGAMDYISGTENAAFIEGVGDYLQSTEMYEVFDCDVVSVHYDACDMPDTALYVEEGRYTNQRIDYYNTNYDTSPITANVAAITYSYLYETEGEKEDSRGAIIRTYEYEFKQSIRVTYVVGGKEYSSEFQNLETYSKYSEVSLTLEEQAEIKNTKGYKVGDSIELYIDSDNPSDCRLKKSVDRMASGSHRKVALWAVLFMGFVLSACVLTTPSKKRRY